MQHEDAVAERRVCFTPQDDGTTDLWASLPSDAAAAMRGVITQIAAVARAGRPDPDQRRADTLIDLVLAPLDPEQGTGDCGAGGGLKPNVNVTVSLSTLLGLDQQSGDLHGVGPIPAALARALAFDPTGTWHRLVTDDFGRFLDATPDTYRPGAALDRHVRYRDRTCRFPGCRRDSGHAELDHLIAFTDGGPTTEANLHALRGRHHHLKHETTWQVRRSPGGSTHWTAPTGHHYRQPPPDPLPVDSTMNPPPPPPTVVVLDDPPF